MCLARCTGMSPWPWQSLQLCGTGRQLHSFLAGLMSKSAGDLQDLQEDSSLHPSVVRPDLNSLLWLVQGKGLSLSCPGVFHELSSSSSKDMGRSGGKRQELSTGILKCPGLGTFLFSMAPGISGGHHQLLAGSTVP